ncbi:MAG: hypothetical protein AAF208_00210 [Cyanobacteria bacterium P01_A01_bin.45]
MRKSYDSYSFDSYSKSDGVSPTGISSGDASRTPLPLTEPHFTQQREPPHGWIHQVEELFKTGSRGKENL